MKSIDDVLSPPLPPRPVFGAGDRAPPPLPPRAHVSPLIQAGLDARLQVRKQKDSLPPKTFTVLQSSSSRSKGNEPRLLTGESAPLGAIEEVTSPSHGFNGKRRASGQRSLTDTIAGSGAPGMKRNPSDDSTEPQRTAAGSVTILAAPKPSRPGSTRHHHSHRRTSASKISGHSGQTPGGVAAPKAQYANGTQSLRSKPTLPSWLREQEELQRTALVEGRPLSPPPSDSITESGDDQSRRSGMSLLQDDLERSRRATTVLDDEYDVYPTELAEQASRAASIDRPHNPFVHRSSQAEAEKLKVQPLPKHVRTNDIILEGPPHSPERERAGLSRSKTLHGKGLPPAPPLASQHPSRKRLESLPATLDSGIHAGFRHSASGGLRLKPPSAKANVGIDDLKRNQGGLSSVIAEGKDSSATSVSSETSSAARISHRGAGGDDEESGEISMDSTNPTSVQELASTLERKLSNRSDTAGSSSLRSKVSDFLKLQDAPPKGQRPIDELKREALKLAERKGWIHKSGREDESLLDVEHDAEDHDIASDKAQWHNDAPTPDDGYGNDSTSTAGTTREAPTPTAFDFRSTLGYGTPPVPPQRSATMSAAPQPRRPSGFVARRASRIEEREQEASGQRSTLGRATSLSYRSGRDNTEHKRRSWLEGLDEERRRRKEEEEGAEGIDHDGVDD